MSWCNVSDDVSEPPEYYHRVFPRARKEYHCCECESMICKGEQREDFGLLVQAQAVPRRHTRGDGGGYGGMSNIRHQRKRRFRSFEEYKETYFPNWEKPLPEDPEEAGREMARRALQELRKLNGM